MLVFGGALLAHKEHGDGVLAGVGADDGADVPDDHLRDGELLLQDLSQSLGLRGAVGVDDIAPLAFGGYDHVVHLVHQVCDGLLAALDSTHSHQAALGIHVDDGLDLEQRAKDGLGSGQAAAPAELGQVAHGDPVVDLALDALAEVTDLLNGLALALLLNGQVHQQALTQGGAQGVHSKDLGLRELLLQVLDGDGTVLVGGAQSGGKGNIQDVLARLEDGAEVLLELIHVGGRGLGILPLEKALVEDMGIGALTGTVIEPLVTQLDGQRDHGQTQVGHDVLGQVAAGIGYDGKLSHVHFLL